MKSYYSIDDDGAPEAIYAGHHSRCRRRHQIAAFHDVKAQGHVPIGNKPILAYVVKALVDNGLKDIIIVVGYRKERIMSFFGDGSKFGAKITYVVQEKQLGTAHALLHVKKLVKEDFVLVSGDNIIDKETVSRIIQHDNQAVLVTESEQPSKYGVIDLRMTEWSTSSRSRSERLAT